MPQVGEVGEEEEEMQEDTRNNYGLTRICRCMMLQEELFRPWRIEKWDLFIVQHVCECVYILTYQQGQCTWFNFSNNLCKKSATFLQKYVPVSLKNLKYMQ